MSDEELPHRRPDFERLEQWCRDSRRWRLWSGFVPLVIGLTIVAMTVVGGEEGLGAQAQLLFGASLCVVAVLPLLQALDRTDWLRLVEALRERWSQRAREDGSEEDLERLRALLGRLTTERMGVHQ